MFLVGKPPFNGQNSAEIVNSIMTPLINKTTEGLEVNSRGGIITDRATGKTSREGLFAGGDVVTGPATVIAAMGAGRLAAKAMDEYIRTKNA